MPKLTDPKVNGRYPFTYTPAAETDLAATFKRVRARKAAELRSAACHPTSTLPDVAEMLAAVFPMRKKEK